MLVGRVAEYRAAVGAVNGENAHQHGLAAKLVGNQPQGIGGDTVEVGGVEYARQGGRALREVDRLGS